MLRKLFPTILSVTFIAILWQYISYKIDYPAIFPTLSTLLVQLNDLIASTDFVLNVFSTVIRAILGFSIAFISAFIFSSISTFSVFWKTFFHPIIVITRSIPVISFVLLALLWFSPDKLPIFIAVLTMFPILYQNILTGLENTDIRWIEMAKVHQKSFLNIYFNIYIPASKTNIFDGISTSLGFGWRAIIIGEVLAQPIRGIGTSMKEAQAYINVSELIAWTVIAILVSYIFDLILKLLRKINFKRSIYSQNSCKNISISQNTYNKTINVRELSKSYNQKNIFSSYNYTFNAGLVYCLKSPSGKGKTTLLRILSKLDNEYAGEVLLQPNLKIGYAFQDFRLLPWLTVSENIRYVINKKQHSAEVSKNLICYLLQKMELTNEANNYPAELSGGQQQRVSLARTLAIEPDILILDEPLTGLDNELKIRIMEFLSEWISSYKPLTIWATHEKIHLKENEIIELFI